MIESRITLSGRVTGFRAGDKQIQLDWNVKDGVGDFTRADITSQAPHKIVVSKDATVIIFIPGTPVSPTVDQAKKNLEKAQTTFDNANEKVEEAQTAFDNADPDDKLTEEKALNDAKKALEDAKKALEDAKKKAEEDAKVTVKVGELSISGTAPTVLTSDISDADSTINIAVAGGELKDCEIIIL
jgi:multidrug efflux pump subunit AcrA (membrane-fusion protein)